MVDAVGVAQKIIENTKLKKSIKEVVDWYNEELKDVVVIFVTKDWYADAFWQNLNKNDLIKVLEAITKGLEEEDETDW